MTETPYSCMARDGQTSRMRTPTIQPSLIRPTTQTLRSSSTVPSILSNNARVTLIKPLGLHLGKAMWLFGAIGRTEHWNQPVSRYTLDNQYVTTVTADVKNNTSYNELFAYFYDLDSSYHTLVVENVNG